MSTLISNLQSLAPKLCSLSPTVSVSGSEASDESRSPSPPPSIVYVSLEDCSAGGLRAVFDSSSVQGRLGLVVGPVDQTWLADKLKDCDGKEIHYHSSSSLYSEPLQDSVPVRAVELLNFSIAGLRSVVSHLLPDGRILYILEKPRVTFPPVSHTPTFPIASSTVDIVGNIPTAEEWHTLWRAWDMVTLDMIPQEMLHQKPIDLRHKCLFYIGHIPTFLDMLLSKAIGGPPSEPKYFWNIFERGIDPHVDDPDHCHNHSEVPEADDDWPTLDTIILFRDRVRARLMALYEDLETGKRPLTRNIARTLVMTLEHEGFHVETLLYMLIQRAGTGILPPPGFSVPPWETLSVQWNNNPPPSSQSVLLGPATLTLGHDDSEADDFLPQFELQVDFHQYGWDNESPARTVEVGCFKADWRPVTNGQFANFLSGPGKGIVEFPKSWVDCEGEIRVRTMFGPVPMAYAQHWPVLTSYNNLAEYARAAGGRLPTESELRLFLNTYDVGHEGGANLGFRNFHPLPATTGLASEGGKGSNGGVWEWTSTIFDSHPGLVPTKLFTGYSADFFDNVHHVVLGASYATIPRLGRSTVRNFYQYNYGFPWVGGRVVYDVAC